MVHDIGRLVGEELEVAFVMATDRPGRLGQIFRDWQLPLRRFLARRKLGSTADIDDIAQEVFLRLLRYDRTELIGHPRAYLFQVATNVSAEWSIRSSRSLPHDSVWLTELVNSLSPELELEQEDRDDYLRLAVEGLPPRARDILRLHFGEGMTYPEIAISLGITRKVVKRDLARAYASLRATVDADLFGIVGSPSAEPPA